MVYTAKVSFADDVCGTEKMRFKLIGLAMGESPGTKKSQMECNQSSVALHLFSTLISFEQEVHNIEISAEER